ncbi:xanthan lyase [Phocaeicola sp.]|uniref:golvesin C-terminal-like domain-containing protein n=1 Tax=Phocaeicola sp. TaxID=2773926 RepID=UPI0023CD5060|nr:xanthan lyase [Phocaeicola sp.]MDE5676414.1 xanthan lyase [Phocaeicola sp.]
MFSIYTKRIVMIFLLLTTGIFGVGAQGLDANVEQRLKDFFIRYETSYANIGKCKLDRYEVDHNKKKLDVYASPSFGYQPFTPENTEAVYRLLKQSLPGPVNYYDITIYTDGKAIEDLIPNYLRKKKDKSRLWQRTDYKGNPWVKNNSRPFIANKGLEGRHIALWQSHGKYYKNDTNNWEWQRPRLFCTTEDLFTQSFVIPYIIPMLENAGAVVYTPRERDWQRCEVVVDNDKCSLGSIYQETKSRKGKWETAPIPAFAHKRTSYQDGENPFEEGTARFASTEKKPEKAFAQWIPNIPETGKYAVYVTYRTLPESVSDAKYLVFHKGGVTEFLVNQQMGGGTWVYLGTFEFDKGSNDYGMVVLSNESNQKGVVCADAVRFGGGMGNISRGGKTSGLPRYLEGARYAAQWSGFPYPVYSPSEGKNDYTDDINARSRIINYLSGNSVYNPHEKGLRVPFEMTLGLHSDAVFSKEDSLIGTLGIYTTDYNDGKLNAGISRYASRDLADMVLTGLQRDISGGFGIHWQRRSLWNRNYSETRLPAVPSMILELLSHQNFADLKLGHDPHFKFTVGRSVYKSVLKYLSTMHETDYVVQPLPVNHFAIRPGNRKNTFQLSWQAVDDPLEPTAKAQEYIVYTRLGYGGFDNGTLVRDTHYTFEAEPGLVYSFKVTAVNKGGESFPSEILSAYQAKRSKGTILIVNGFNRLSGPATVESPFIQGFDLNADPGIPYINTPAFCGIQQSFDRSRIGRETPDGLGHSGSELEGMLVAGNTFDYPFVHGKAIQAARGYSFVSCSDEAVENGFVRLTDYPIIDWVSGAEKQPFSNTMQQLITTYCQQGGKLMLSGSYVGSSMNSPSAQSFTKNILKYAFGGSMRNSASSEIYGADISFCIPRSLNEQTYVVSDPDCLTPIAPAYSAFVYSPDNHSAGIAYKGTYRTFVLGFPFESIQGIKKRAKIMGAILHFLDNE